MTTKVNPFISQRSYRLGETYLLENAIKTESTIEIGDIRMTYSQNCLENKVTMHVCDTLVASWLVDIDKIVCEVLSKDPNYRDLMLDFNIFRDIVLEYQYFNMLDERC